MLYLIKGENMKFTEFRRVIDKIVELQIEVENIKKEEYEKLSRRE